MKKSLFLLSFAILILVNSTLVLANEDSTTSNTNVDTTILSEKPTTCENNVCSVADFYSYHVGDETAACFQDCPSAVESPLDLHVYYYPDTVSESYNDYYKIVIKNTGTQAVSTKYLRFIVGGEDRGVVIHQNWGYDTIEPGTEKYYKIKVDKSASVSSLCGKPFVWSIAQKESDEVLALRKGNLECIRPEVKDTHVNEQRSEKVTCMFKEAAGKELKCYSENEKYSCTATHKREDGISYCTVDVSGNYGDKLTWKSSCGSYQYTKIDGADDSIKFNCLENKETSTENIKEHYFRVGYWQCYDGAKQTNIDDSSCKPAELWQKYAKEFCEGHCSKESGKCGVSAFAVVKDCYPDSKDIISTPPVSLNESIQVDLTCKDSCPSDGKCYPFGYRKDSQYCSDSGAFTAQTDSDLTCQNNFECSSNVCVSGKCVSPGLIEKALSWLKRFFGGE